MPETTERETVSIEAHQRVVAERDALKAQVDDLSGTVKDFKYIETAEPWFKARGVEDTRGWAELALPHIRMGDLEDIAGVLEQRFGTKLPAGVAPAAVETPEAQEEPPAPIESPRPSVAGPNPSAPGEPVSAQPQVQFGSAEWQRIVKTEGMAGIKRLEAEGRFTLPDRRA